jgi:hypothetical protein
LSFHIAHPAVSVNQKGCFRAETLTGDAGKPGLLSTPRQKSGENARRFFPKSSVRSQYQYGINTESIRISSVMIPY